MPEEMSKEEYLESEVTNLWIALVMACDGDEDKAVKLCRLSKAVEKAVVNEHWKRKTLVANRSEMK